MKTDLIWEKQLIFKQILFFWFGSLYQLLCCTDSHNFQVLSCLDVTGESRKEVAFLALPLSTWQQLKNSNNCTPQTLQNTQDNTDIALISHNMTCNSFLEAACRYIPTNVMGVVAIRLLIFCFDPKLLPYADTVLVMSIV